MREEMKMFDRSEEPSKANLWEHFVTNIWEKKPNIITRDLACVMELVPPISQEDLFAMASETINKWVCEERALVKRNIRFFIDGVMQFNSATFNRSEFDINEFIDCLPKQEDKNFEQYNNRLEEVLGNKAKNYMINIEPIEFSATLRNWLYGLMQNLYTRLGYIVNDSYVSVFYGNYDKTPFGAHVHDNQSECEGAFFVSLQGNKKVRTWSNEFVKTIPEHPNFDPNQNPTQNYQPFNAESMVLSTTPGQVIYWTADTWHVAENQSKKVIAFPVAVRVANDVTSAFLKDILISATSSGAQSLNLSDAQVEFIIVTLDAHLEREKDVLLRDTKYGKFSISGEDLQEIAQTAPIELEAIAKKLLAVFSESELELIKSKFWLKTLTSFGITQEFHRECHTHLLLDFSNIINLYQNIPLVWKENDQNMLISAAGKLLCTAENQPKEAIKKMVDILNKKESIKVSKLIESCLLLASGEDCSKYDNDYFISILQVMSSWQIFEITC